MKGFITLIRTEEGNVKPVVEGNLTLAEIINTLSVGQMHFSNIFIKLSQQEEPDGKAMEQTDKQEIPIGSSNGDNCNS